MRPAMATVQGHEQLSRKAANSGLFNHIVSDGEHPRRDCKAERLCSLQVDNKVEFRRLQYWQIAGFRAFKIFPA